ncbi:alcohol dehydrogenase superfamily protein [Infundibulicybe gibba]|nr:alcohol dehydrogenase superfamily protein [Infundibulicybe gibba]
MASPSTAREYFFSELGSHTNLAVKSAPVRQPKATEVLVKVHAVSLQFRDLAIAYKRYPVVPPKDLVPCSDMAGEVVAVGEDVKKWKKGDRGEYSPEIQQSSLGGESHGVLTEYKILPAHALVQIPAHLSYEEASALPCAAVTAYNALHGPIPVKAGDNVLILGTGGVLHFERDITRYGISFALQFALASGAVVIVTSSSDEKLKIASKLGAHHVINYKKNPDWEQEVLKLTGGVGVDHVVEVLQHRFWVGGPGTLPKSIAAAKINGSVHVIGFVAQDSTDISAILAIIAKSVTLRGLFVGSVANFANMNRLIAAHPEKTRPIIDKVFPFEQAQDAYAHLASQAHVGKVVIKVSKN